MNILRKKPERRETGHNSVKTASLLLLTVVFMLVLCGAASAANTPLNTTHNGTVSGDLYVNATQPVAFADQPTDATSREFNQTYNLPTNSSANGTDIQWAEVYVNIYSGSGSNNWPVNATILLDGDGDGVYETTLGTELLTNTNYSTDGTIYWINDHCYRVYSDYMLWYDVTGLITCTNPSIYVKTEQVGTDPYDGRLKMITLVAAYNDGDDDEVYYWVNDGQDWISSGSTSSTTFNTSTMDADTASATLTTVALSSKDGTYDFNGTTNNGTDPVAPVNYFVTHTWDVTAAITRGNNSTLNFTAGSGSFKMVLATLTLRKVNAEAPVADFTAETTRGFAPLTVQFTDNSTGANTWAWDFDNDGFTDSTEQNPTYTYTDAGSYTVNLTVTGPGGSNTETKTNYIAAISNNYISYLGGTVDEVGYSIAVDDDGNIYIVGHTTSTDFPTTSDAYQKNNASGYDIFLAKFNSVGDLVYSTYLGGSGNEAGYSTALDDDGNIYITGYTASTDFPTTSDAYQKNNASGYDVFLAKFNSDGSLVYSTYLGGTNTDYGYGIAVDDDGNIYITGYTASTDFPTTTGANQTTYGGGSYDAFVTKFNSDGSLVYSTYLGGTDTDSGQSIAVDEDGNIYITGRTKSSDLPVTTGAYQTTLAGGYDAFVAKFDSNGSLSYSTYFGGTNTDYGYGIAVDGSGSAYITGQTKSSDLPVTTGAYQTTFAGSTYDAFVAKLNPNGTSLVYSTYLGGTASNSIERATGIAVDSEGNAYVTGYTNSGDFPVTSWAYQTSNNGGFYGDIFLTKLNSDGTSLFYSTFLGGSGNDLGNAIAIDSEGNAYITGYTNSANFPVTAGAYQTNITNSYTEVYVAKLDLTSPVADFTADDLSDYAPLTVQFTDQSTSKTDLVAWAWDFDNDGTVDSTEQNPTYTYTTPGTYTVKLTVSNVGGSNSTTKMDYVTAVTPPDDTEAPTVTVTPTGGEFTSVVQIVMSATDNYDSKPKIYYTLDGTTPTTSSTLYTDPITITENTVLKYISADRFGNIGNVQTETYTINDTEAPIVTATPVGGVYHEITQVILSVTDNVDPNPVIYYTLDGSNIIKYTEPINIPNYVTTTLKFTSIDKSGNITPIQTEIYTISDIEAPTVTASQNVTTITMSATDNMDSDPKIYYTIDGTDPTTNSTLYTGSFTIPRFDNTVVKYIAVDVSGNSSPVQSETYSTIYDKDLVTTYYAEGNIGIIVSLGGTGYGGGDPTYVLDLPEGATILAAHLCLSWNWYGYVPYTVTFNGSTVTDLIAHYTAYSGYYNLDDGDGQDIYDVTAYITNGTNTATITGGTANYGRVLIVVYQCDSEPYRQIWIDEGFHNLYYEGSTAYAFFKNVTTDKVTSAQITVMLPSGDNDSPNISFNGITFAINETGGSDPSFKYYDVTSALQDGTNELDVIGGGAYFALQNAILTITYDLTAPNVTADPASGAYNTTQIVTLTATDDQDTSPEIYYTTDGTDPTTSSTMYTDPISIGTITTLKFIAVDDAGNVSDMQSETYTIDTTVPTVTADLISGSYNTSQNVTLTATDNLDTSPDIYYTTDGTIPTTTSTLYSGSISITANTTLKFIAVDDAGNSSDVQTEVYIIDTVSPSVSASVDSGIFGKTQNVTLSATDNEDTQPDIYYTTDGTIPTTSSTLYAGPIGIGATTTLKFFAVDDAGNTSTVESKTYIIDTQAPTVTVNPAGGIYNTSKTVTLTATDNITANPTIYYTTDGTTPTTSSTQYTGPISITTDTTLQFIAVDILGNISPVQSETYTIDTEAPTVAADITTGLFNTTQNVIITATDNLDTKPDIYYTTDGKTPTTGSTLYTSPITVDATTTLMFFAVDDAGNMSDVQTEVYTIDMEAPNVTADPAGVSFNTSQTVTLTATDNLDTNPDIYYTMDGTTPTTGSTLYSGPITVDATTMLNFIALDDAGNVSLVQSEIYTLDTEVPVVIASMGSGLIGSGESVTLIATDNEDTSPDIYYTTDGTTPTTSSTLYTGPISIDETMVLKFFAVDEAGNASQVESRTYTVDAEAPTVTANPASGIYNTASVVLTATDNMDANPTIYYTTDGTTPTTSSTLYTGPISITADTTLQFIAVDILGNTSPVQSETYTISTDTTAPTIVTVDPSNGTTSIAGDAIFTITFSEDIMEGTGWIELVDSSGTAIPFTTSISGNVLTITPTNDLGESSYKLMIHSGSVTDLAGNLLAGKSFRFSVGTAPTITATSPVDGATNVSVAKTLTVTFSEAIRKSSSFWVELVDSTGAAVNYTSYITSGNVLVINPVDDLAANTTYQLKLHTGCVTDLAGNLLAAKIISFSTRNT